MSVYMVREYVGGLSTSCSTLIVIRSHRKRRTDAPYCYTCRTVRGLCGCLFVCVLDISMRPAKTAELIEMPFGGQTHVDPRTCTLAPHGEYDCSAGVMRPVATITVVT